MVMKHASNPSRSGRRPDRPGTLAETTATDKQASGPAAAAPVTVGYDPEVVAWVTESCGRHGVAVKVLDAAVVARVAVLLGAPSRPSPSRRSPPGSQLERESSRRSESPGGRERGELSA